MHIPLTKPYWGKREERAAVRAIRTSSGVGDGPYTKKLIRELQKLTGVKYIFPVTSCTHGLELVMQALVHESKLNPGDEVILPSFTMSSTANAVVLAGGVPVFADIEPKFYNIDPEDIEKRISARTRGIIIVHYAGMPCYMEKIQKIAKKHNLWVVEDAAHAIGAYYKKRMLGTWGTAGVFSFHGTKNVSSGEGGVVLTNDKKLADYMDIYRANGTNRKAYLEGVVDKYSWVDKGSSFFLCDILASILIEQIHQIKTITKKRHQIASLYNKELQKLRDIVTLPTVPDQTDPNWHIYAILFHDEEKRKFFMQQMRAQGIEVSLHYVPLHSSEMGVRLRTYSTSLTALQLKHPPSQVTVIPNLFRDLQHNNTILVNPDDSGKGVSSPGITPYDKQSTINYQQLTINNLPILPVTDEVSRLLVRLPIYPGLTKRELKYIITTMSSVLERLKLRIKN